MDILLIPTWCRIITEFSVERCGGASICHDAALGILGVPPRIPLSSLRCRIVQALASGPAVSESTRYNTVVHIVTSRVRARYLLSLRDRPGSSAIPDPHLHNSPTSTCPPSRSGPRHSEDGLSVQTLSTIPPSYHTRRPDHEVEPWTLPPAYGTPHDAARPPSAYIPGQRVLRLHGPRSSPSLSSLFSSRSHTIRDRKSTYATSVRTASSHGQEEDRSRHKRSVDEPVPSSSVGGLEGTQSGGGVEGDMHDGWSSVAPSYRTVS
ncbi:hypothetical protein OH76DRAFT_198273 [Lentinus brumalis]|uniref:Uncharacterized protein n=1 Tax=Lentinus brumalis TaxID=2498619 RepID=A0A371DI61_9APHY|nr:hypothetical protein OH76DRAFT_198273 [Polyporus brumalis]